MLLLFVQIKAMAVCHKVAHIKKKQSCSGSSKVLNLVTYCELNTWSRYGLIVQQMFCRKVCPLSVHTCLSLNNPFSVPLEVFWLLL